MSRSASRPTAANRRALAEAASRAPVPAPAAPADPPWLPALQVVLAAHGVGLETWRAWPDSNCQTAFRCLADAVRLGYEAGLAGRAGG